MSLDFKNNFLIFCDGACSGNPGRGGWGAIIVSPEGHVTELGGSQALTTNNKMELTAVIEALLALKGAREKVILCTDSVYVIRGITQWIFGWRKKGWKTAEGNDVSNQDLWERLSKIVYTRGHGAGIDWKFVRGHSGVPGNERCDEIAVAFSKGKFVDLYSGPLLKYGVAIHDIPEDTSLPELKERTEAKPKAYSYLSLLGGVPMRHSSWLECERRVKGQSGAKFKKAASSQEELEILSSWGVSAEKLKK